MIKLESTQATATRATGVIYGPSGIGKTRLALTYPCLVVNTERGLLSLRKDQVAKVDITSREEMDELLTALYSDKPNPFNKFKNYHVDSISDLGEVILGQAKAKNKNGQAAYGQTNDTVMMYFRAWRDLPNKNVTFIAKETNFNELGVVKMRPSMPDKYLTEQLPYMFDFILHMTHFTHTDGNRYIGLHCRADYQTTSKDRGGTLDEWEQPDMSHILNKMLKG